MQKNTSSRETSTIKRGKPISTGSDWTFELVQEYDRAIAEIAQEYGLDTYPNQLEIISSEQMMDAYASVGMPIGYNHWSYGKQFLSVEQSYKRGQMGLAYEIVINSNPCIAYLMEENTMMMQALVIAHACYGHNSFFKGNYLFTSWTDATSIIDYLVFAKNYISSCEEKHGIAAVESVIDSCHAIMNYGVDRYKRPYPLSTHEESERQKEREEYLQKQVNDLWRTIPSNEDHHSKKKEKHFPEEPQENLLYFFEKNAPLLEPWQREVVRIVRKIAQYFYPQRQTQVMNEGWACFWHHFIINTMYDRGLVTDGFMLEFMQSHSSVIYQPGYNSQHFSGINPYTLGFHMMTDIKRICEKPTEEDRAWFPDFAGSNWRETLEFAMRNFKDESFILQFLSPHLMRELKLFSILDNDDYENLHVKAIHDESGYRAVKECLSAQYNIGNHEPNIQVYNVDIRGDRSLTLRHYRHNRKPLSDDTSEVLKHIHRLWGFDVHLHSVEGDEIKQTFHVPPKPDLE
ncbi:MAG: SpoVR family protein [Cellvibrionaceae bacterium]|nr:SpoVR family protein [Cellvibrionaceae bacterium]